MCIALLYGENSLSMFFFSFNLLNEGEVMLDTDVEAFAYEQSKKNRTGRPNKLNDTLIEEICDLIAEGYTFAEAARFRRISQSTFFRWMAMGKREDAAPMYKELVIRVTEAAEFSELEALQAIRASAIKKNDAKAAMWLLERRYPEKYGRDRVNEKDCHGESTQDA
jgi:hypothetical protein